MTNVKQFGPKYKGLSKLQKTILRSIEHHGGQTCPAAILAEHFGFTPYRPIEFGPKAPREFFTKSAGMESARASLSRALARLEQRGLIEIERWEHIGRVEHLVIKTVNPVPAGNRVNHYSFAASREVGAA